MNRNIYPSLLALLCSIGLFSGCKKEEEAPHDDHGEVRTVDLRLAFVFKYGTHDYELTSEYTDSLGHLYSLDRVRFLLSDLHVVDDELNVLATYPNVQLLVDAAQPANDFALGSLTASHAHQIRFTMGLNDPLNHADPATSPAPLNDPDMHWGPAADQGFWFVVLEGHWDSDNSGLVDSTDAPFTYRCGTDDLIRTGWAIMHLEIPDGGTLTIETTLDMERLMGGVDVAGTDSAWGANALNVQLMDSLSAIFNEVH
ncbi:MAG: hypothetical protein IPP26_15775 [Flavobacteriales bacterium]|nr:hypothetical protein [Flavobacteriales bacterium]